MRAVALHRDVLVVTSALLQVNCVIVRGGASAPSEPGGEAAVLTVIEPGERDSADETFVIDSPVLPDELDALGALIAQAGFPEPSGLLSTHADWDHLLGRLAFPDLALGCAESTARRLASEPGAAQRELRDFDDELYIDRPRPLALGSVQGLPVPGHCEIGARELELHATGGHTADGMAVGIRWAGVFVAGDYLSAAEIPSLNDGGSIDVYEQTLQALQGPLEGFPLVVSGHGPTVSRERALELLDEDLAYLRALRSDGASASLPHGRDGRRDRAIHERNAASLAQGAL